jgi:hypothetical protein
MHQAPVVFRTSHATVLARIKQQRKNHPRYSYAVSAFSHKPNHSDDIVDVQQQVRPATTDAKSASRSPGSAQGQAAVDHAGPLSPAPKDLSPITVVLGALAAILVSLCILAQRGSGASTAATFAAAAAEGYPAAAASAALSVLQHTTSLLFAPAADVAHHMFLGWQHLWLLMNAHPLVAPLQQSIAGSTWASSITQLQVLQILSAAAVAVAAVFWILKRYLQHQQSAIR